jgi:hypothetical protein
MTIVSMTASLTATWTEVAVSNVPMMLTALLPTGEEVKPAELNAAPTPLASSLSPVKLMLTAPPELLPALWLRKSALSACSIITAVNLLLLVPLVNNNALSASLIPTALLDKNVVLTKLVETITPTFLDLPSSTSLALACLWSSPLFSDFNGMAN